MSHELSVSSSIRLTFFEAWPKLALLCLACPILALAAGSIFGDQIYFLLAAIWFAIDIPLLLVWRGFSPPSPKPAESA